MNVRPVHRSVAPRAPTGALAQVERVGSMADVDFSWGDTRSLDLRVAFEAEVSVTLDQHLAIDRAVWVVANGAALPQSLMLEDKGPGLFAMAPGAILVEPRHSQPAGSLKDVTAVRIVALHAIHVAFEDRVMLGQVEFGVGLKMALKTRCWVSARVDDELSASTS